MQDGEASVPLELERVVKERLHLMLERHEAAECKLTRARGVSALSQRDQGSAKGHSALGRFITVVLQQRSEDGHTALLDDESLDLRDRPLRRTLGIAEDESDGVACLCVRQLHDLPKLCSGGA